VSGDQYSFSSEAHTGVRTILVVEDDEDLGEFLVQAIRQETPHQVLHVTDGFKALKAVRSLRPDLLLLDYRLPGMNGIELYDRLHLLDESTDIPAIMLSTNFPIHEAQKRQMMCLKKPIDLDTLLHALEKLLA